MAVARTLRCSAAIGAALAQGDFLAPRQESQSRSLQASSTESPTNATDTSTTLFGGYRDPHGCIPSAGYLWCESSEKCLRPWEEDCDSWTEALSSTSNTDGGGSILGSHGEPTPSSSGAPNATTDTSTTPFDCYGCYRDPHGCIPSAGYLWCESSDKCVRPWEEECDSWTESRNSTGTTTQHDLPGDAPGSDRDANGCRPSAGYKWCASLDKCLRPWEDTCDSWTEGDEGAGATTTTTAVSAGTETPSMPEFLP